MGVFGENYAANSWERWKNCPFRRYCVKEFSLANRLHRTGQLLLQLLGDLVEYFGWEGVGLAHDHWHAVVCLLYTSDAADE